MADTFIVSIIVWCLA